VSETAPAEALLLSVEEGIATVTINRPAARNALSLEVMAGLSRAWQEIDARDDIRVAILTSADCGTFCAGLDLKEAAQCRAAGTDILSRVEDPYQDRMRALRVPVIAAMTGHVLAGGMMLSLNCDLRVGMAGTRVGITEVKVGRGSPWAVPLLWMLPQPVLSQLMLTGETLAIERLQELGFVNFVEADADAVRARAEQLAATIAEAAPLSVQAGKAALRAGTDLGCAAGLAQAHRLYAPVYDSDDAREGPLAFAEKRTPKWKGR